MEPVPYIKIKELANQYNDALLATDPRFQGSVRVSHRDGSDFLFTKAFMMKKGSWLIVFSDHHGVHVYHDDDVIYQQYHTDDHTLQELP